MALTWLETRDLPAAPDGGLAAYDALWCVPASPYAHMPGALAAIQYAREAGVPFLGTCGGFQHALIEWARNVLGLVDADHLESNPDAALPLVAPLACSLQGARGRIHLLPGTRIAATAASAAASAAVWCCARIRKLPPPIAFWIPNDS